MYLAGLVPDKEVRVSVKALAVSCVGAAAALFPETFFNRLYLEPLDGQQTDGKILEYVLNIIIVKNAYINMLFIVVYCNWSYIPVY